MRDLLLTGFMGTGKTTVGRILARRYGLTFVDSDAEIERRTGRSISDIVTGDGEAAFRRIERDILRRLARGRGRVIATGGGALLTGENRSFFDDDQPVVCLTCEPATLLFRLGSGVDRPLLDPPSLQRIADLLERREEAYATFPQIDTTGKTVDLVADEIASRYPLEQAGSIEFERSSSSDILVGEGLLDGIGGRLEPAGGRVLVVTDATVERHGHAARVLQSLTSAGLEGRLTVLPPGEQTKSMRTLEALFETCLREGLDRSGTIVGVGGGVVGDLAGMLAATYMRGVRLLLAPTTLLAQVDAAIGGKVAVDAAGTKNLAGAFYPAEIVAIDPTVLRTLDGALLAEGMAEIVKIAFMQSEGLLQEIEGLDSPEGILSRPDILRQSAQLKVELVARDPYESGDRMLLNFGHTVGHGVEAASGYRLSHGRAVAIGMAAELRLAAEVGYSAHELPERLGRALSRFGLPDSAQTIDADDVIVAIGGDKKRSNGTARIAVPVRAGEGRIFPASRDDMRRAVEFALQTLPGVPADTAGRVRGQR